MTAEGEMGNRNVGGQRPPLQEQAFQFRESPLKKTQRAFDRRWSCHVDTSSAEGFQRELCAAGLQEFEVGLNGAGLAPEDTFRKCNRGRNTGGVFVDVERVIKMRDSEALQIEFRIEHDARPEVNLEKAAILLFEDVERQGVAAFFDGVNDFLELGEHRLAEKRAPDVVDLAIDNVGPHLLVGGLVEEMMGEQFLIKGRGDFGEEDWIVVILKALGALREPGVHGMAGLVRESVDVGENVTLIVHQDVGGRAEAPGRESATPFPFRFVSIAPTTAQPVG